MSASTEPFELTARDALIDAAINVDGQHAYAYRGDRIECDCGFSAYVGEGEFSRHLYGAVVDAIVSTQEGQK